MSLGKKMIALYQLIFQGEPQQQMPKTISQEPGYKRGIYKKGREVGGGEDGKTVDNLQKWRQMTRMGFGNRPRLRFPQSQSP